MANGGIIGPVNDPTGDVTTTFTASGTYTSPGFGPGQADYLVVAGGGGGGVMVGGGGGGAGGYRTSFPGGTKLSVPSSPISSYSWSWRSRRIGVQMVKAQWNKFNIFQQLHQQVVEEVVD
jgi:hypothetical protein